MKIHFIDGEALSDAEWFAFLNVLAREEDIDVLITAAFRAMAEEDCEGIKVRELNA